MDRLCQLLVQLFEHHDCAAVATESALEDDIAQFLANPSGGFPDASDNGAAGRDRWSEVIETACDILALELDEWDECDVLAGIRCLSERSGETELRDALGSLTPARRNRIEEQLRREMDRLGLEMPTVDEPDRGEDSALPPARPVASRSTDQKQVATLDSVIQRLLELKEHGVTYSSNRKLADQLNCSPAQINRAVNESGDLRAWQEAAKNRRAKESQETGSRERTGLQADQVEGGSQSPDISFMSDAEIKATFDSKVAPLFNKLGSPEKIGVAWQTICEMETSGERERAVNLLIDACDKQLASAHEREP